MDYLVEVHIFERYIFTRLGKVSVELLFKHEF